MQQLVLLDDQRNYVAADVLDTAQINLLHPREVPARDVEQHAGFKLAKRLRQLGAKCPSGVESGSHPRSGLRVGPEIGRVDPGETLRESELSQLVGSLLEPPLRDRALAFHDAVCGVPNGQRFVFHDQSRNARQPSASTPTPKRITMTCVVAKTKIHPRRATSAGIG